ncbi:MAG: hypothetical protein ABH879_10510 [archaeon]
MANSTAYRTGLASFLEVSGQDHIEADGILGQLPSYAPKTLNMLREKGHGRMLDIGAGNGMKALYITEGLSNLGAETTIDSLEPREEQREELLRTYKSHPKHRGRVHPVTLGNFHPYERYDITLLIHSLYEFPRNNDGTISTLSKLTELMGEGGTSTVVIEDPESDLQKMKRSLYPEFGKCPPISRRVVEGTLEKERMKYTAGQCIKFGLDVSHLLARTDAEIGRDLSFLFSDSLSEGGLNMEQMISIGKWVRSNHQIDAGIRFLWTPDIVIWVTA